MAHVRVVVDDGTEVPACLGAALATLDASVSFQPTIDQSTPDADAFVFVGHSEGNARLDGALRRVMDRACGALVLGGRPDPRFARCPVDYASFDSGDDLATRILNVIALRPTLKRVADARARSEQIEARYNRRAGHMRKLTREIDSPALPKFGRLRFETLTRSLDDVSGDLFDIRRLDRRTVAVTLSDAEGHGLPAAMLNTQIERTLSRQSTRDPAEALAAVNNELLENRAGEGSFATLVYAIIDLKTLEVRLARGGAPYPIYRGPRGTLRLVRPNGPLIGVLPEARFDVAKFRLTPDATLMLYSDGLEVITAANAPAEVHATVGSPVDPAAGAAPLGPMDWNASAAAPDLAITNTPWYHEFSHQGSTQALRTAARRHDLLRRLGRPVDDLTMLSIRVAS